MQALVNCYKTDVALAVHLSDLLSKNGVLNEFDEGYTLGLIWDWYTAANANLDPHYPFAIDLS